MKNLTLLDTRGEDRPLIESLLHTLSAEAQLARIGELAEWASPKVRLPVTIAADAGDGETRRAPPRQLCSMLTDWVAEGITHEAYPWGDAFVIRIDCPGRRYTLFSESATIERFTDRLHSALYVEDLAPFATVEDLPEEA